MKEFDIKKIRERLGLTQEEFGGLLGVSGRTVQYWERGREIPKTKHEIFRRMEQNSISGDNISGFNVTMNKGDKNDMALMLLNLLNQKEASLHKAQEQVSKSQEHIDRLIKVLEEKLSNKK